MCVCLNRYLARVYSVHLSQQAYHMLYQKLLLTSRIAVRDLCLQTKQLSSPSDERPALLQYLTMGG